MRKFSLLLLFMLTAIFSVCAQNKVKERDMRKEIVEYKMKFLAQEMDLKEDQQKKFFEIYSQMTDERMKVVKDRKELEKKLNNDANASDEEFKKAMESINSAKSKEAEIEKKYDAKFSEFLTQKQIFKMKAAEEKFNDRMREMHKTKRIDGKIKDKKINKK